MTRAVSRFAIWFVALVLALAAAVPVRAGGAQSGTASWFGPGDGAATQWCTWTLRHSEGCGLLAVQSHQTGVVVIVPVIDWCQCYRGTPNERIVDLQWGVVDALGLEREQGTYPVSVWRVSDDGLRALPDTAAAR